MNNLFVSVVYSSLDPRLHEDDVGEHVVRPALSKDKRWIRLKKISGLAMVEASRWGDGYWFICVQAYWSGSSEMRIRPVKGSSISSSRKTAQPTDMAQRKWTIITVLLVGESRP